MGLRMGHTVITELLIEDGVIAPNIIGAEDALSRIRRNPFERFDGLDGADAAP